MNYTTDPLSQVQGGMLQTTSQGMFTPTGEDVLRTVDPAQAQNDPNAVMGNITRGMWAHWEGQYKPLIGALQKYTTYNGNPGIQDALLNQAKTDTATAFTDAAAQQGRAVAGMGVAPTAAETQAIDQQRGMAQGLAQVDAANRIRTLQKDLNRQLAAGINPQQQAKKAEEAYL